MDSVLQGIQQDVVDRLLADPYFDNVPVLSEDLKDIENEIERAVKKLGIVAIVLMPSATVGKMKDAPGPYWEHVKIILQVTEFVTANRSSTGTGKTNLAVCEHGVAILHRYQPTNLSEAIYAEDPTITLIPDPNGLLTRHVNMATHAGIKYDIPAVADPVISYSGGLVTVACATAHANVVVTIDGTPPKPRRTITPGTAFFYTAPFSAPIGTKVKTKAFLAGYLDSKQVNQTLS